MLVLKQVKVFGRDNKVERVIKLHEYGENKAFIEIEDERQISSGDPVPTGDGPALFDRHVQSCIAEGMTELPEDRADEIVRGTWISG